MAGSVLIYGGNKQNRIDQCLLLIDSVTGAKYNIETLIQQPDIKIIETKEDKKSIGVEEIKEAIDFLKERPFSKKYKCLVFIEAEKILDRAQNMLLKVLEEPPTFAHIFLLTKTQDDLIETVASRCKRVDASKLKKTITKAETFNNLNFEILIASPIGKRLDAAEELGKEEDSVIIETLEIWLQEARGVMKKNTSSQLTSNMAVNLKLISEVLKVLQSQNVNTKLALENLVLQLL